MGPSPGWGPVRVGAHMGPYGPIGPILFNKSLILMKNHKIANKNIEGVKSGKRKVKMWFCDKDLSSVSLLSETYDFTKMLSLFSKTYDFIKMINLFSKTHDFIKSNKFV